MSFIKTTIVGGLVFLVPVVVLVAVIGEAMGVLLVVAEPVAESLPMDSVAGMALANLIAALTLTLMCFTAGLVARSGTAQRLTRAAESALLQRVPGYTFLKGLTSTLSPEENTDLRPALISFGNVERIGLEVDRVGGDRVAVFFPGSPNAWSGIMQIVPAGQVKPIQGSIMDIMQCAEQMGRGTSRLLVGDENH